MLQNAYLVAKIGADTAENEQHFAEILPKTGNYSSWSSGRECPVLSPGPLLSPAGLSLSLLPRVRASKISKLLQIFGGLVLGCIKTKFCKKICVWQHFSSATRFAYFCTAAISKFSQKIGLKNQQFSWKFSKNFANVAKFAKFCQISRISAW